MLGFLFFKLHNYRTTVSTVFAHILFRGQPIIKTAG